MTRILAFDVDDTITESKQEVKPKMATLLEDLSYNFDLLFISGCSLERMEEQLLKFIKPFNATFLLPCSGSQGYLRSREHEIWNYQFSNADFEKIEAAFEAALKTCKYKVSETWGPIPERKGGQITFSLLGQQAPLSEKKRFDPEQNVRKLIISHMQKNLPDYNIKIGGTTSIDVFALGTKADGLHEFLKFKTYYKKQDILFFGDSLSEGGNDRSVLDEGFAVVKVNSPEETYQYLQGL